ncbi:hypothetical protein [Sphingomonas sp. CFBP 8760]|uniref:hypothetical protein n=1 Tax=Sphingomonas sp. CFBP 8760 TaxID=2775282 RepID=UPI001A924FC6|nr:hypothetical protein [Sphingomonas sp. CFBP 8760]
MSVPLSARPHGITGSHVFIWRRLMYQGALTAAAASEEVVPASGNRMIWAMMASDERYCELQVA